ARPLNLARRHGRPCSMSQRGLEAFGTWDIHPPQRSRPYRRCPRADGCDFRCRALPVRFEFPDREIVDRLPQTDRGLSRRDAFAPCRPAPGDFQEHGHACLSAGTIAISAYGQLTTKEEFGRVRCRWKLKSWIMATSNWSRASLFWGETAAGPAGS